ncbi:GntR family transcriptional regulator [Roseovarius pacificus]|uniref:GntR family transcriptional regulator n=1 Tax=Roseovarius pacificus TaxID=337701 RepID=UPI002A187602|nr:GntR family transcriptional regulator [Roseovarius pacificus]
MHETVADTLRERIAFGVYSEEDLLPPEVMLAAELNVSRHTIREAMKSLVLEGLIKRNAGLGTTILPQTTKAEKWTIRSLDDLYSEFMYDNTIILNRGIIPARERPEVRDLFSLSPSASLYLLERVLFRDEGPAAINRLYTLVKYISHLPQDEIGHRPLIQMIKEYNRIAPFKTQQLASASSATPEDAELLGIEPGAALLVLKRTYLSQKGTPLLYTELFCRPDRYQQAVEFIREDDSAD